MSRRDAVGTWRGMYSVLIKRNRRTGQLDSTVDQSQSPTTNGSFQSTSRHVSDGQIQILLYRLINTQLPSTKDGTKYNEINTAV